MGQHTLNKVARFFQHGPRYLKGGGSFKGTQFAGRTTLASGSASVTVSTPAIGSDAVVMWGTQVSSITGGLSSGGGGVVVNSVVHARSFAFAWQGGIGIPQDVVVMWEILKRSP